MAITKVWDDRDAGSTTHLRTEQPNVEKSYSIHHLQHMLRLVESLAIKAERAKTTTIEFFPLREAPSHKCGWCETYAKGNPKGWHSYRGVDHSYPGGSNVGGDVCSAKECWLSIQAKYAARGPSTRHGTGSR
jgi:hypothetical protein